MEAPHYQQPPLDPQIALSQQKAQQDNIAALQTTTGMDTARLMALYGSPAGGSSSGSGPAGGSVSPFPMAHILAMTKAA